MERKYKDIKYTPFKEAERKKETHNFECTKYTEKSSFEWKKYSTNTYSQPEKKGYKNF